jgi:hypothetical protein
MKIHDLSAGVFPALAAGLCQDRTIGFRVGAHWCFDPRRHVIEANKRHIDQEPVLALGLLAHEASHVWISRYGEFSPAKLRAPVWAAFMNGLEDPRANGWMQLRYPGSVPWFRRMYDYDRGAPVARASRFLSWVAAASIADAYHWSETAPWIADHPSAREAFRITSDARRRYAQEVPRPDPTAAADRQRLTDDYLREVEAKLKCARPLHEIDAVEMSVLRSAARAMKIAVSEILPVVRPLIAEDERAIANFLVDNPKIAEAVRSGLRRGHDDVREVVDLALRSPTDRRTDGDTRLARRAFEHYVGQRGRRSRGGGSGFAELPRGVGSGRPVRGRSGPEAGRIDNEMLATALKTQLPALVRDLEALLEPRRNRRFRAGYPTGQRLDLRRAMAFEADRRAHDRLWCRRRRPDGPRAAVSLLVDLSGSMRGEKIEAATIGTLLLAEALDRLGPKVRYAVTGFQDELIPFLDFGQSLSAATRVAILEMPLEVCGERPGGRNRPSYNDDGPCLAETAKRLRREPGQRLLLVVSDGHPAGRRSDSRDLEAAITRLSGPGAGLTLLGLGLGPRTDHVTKFYPNAVADIPLKDFAARIAALLKGTLGRSLASAGRARGR